jgi:hypothetical protein
MPELKLAAGGVAAKGARIPVYGRRDRANPDYLVL